jgi:hypothetical protein
MLQRRQHTDEDLEPQVVLVSQAVGAALDHPDLVVEPFDEAAFADPDRTADFLSLAEEAARTQPGDGRILLLAATAALLDQNPERAQVFLKRFSKRYVAIAPYQT